MTQTARLEIDDKRYELPIIAGTDGGRAIDIAQLREQTGLITLDTAYKNTGSCTSGITLIDGERGILCHRGYPIEQLAERAGFLEVAHLLIDGELPDPDQLEEWTRSIRYHTMLHADVERLFEAFPKDAHPMAVSASAIAALSTFYPQDLDPLDPRQARASVDRLIAKFPTIVAHAYKHSLGQPFLYPDNKLGYIESFLRMMFGTPCEEFAVDPVVARTVDTLLVLYADHEQNCATSTVRLVGSSRVNLFGTISSAIMALWGTHGAVNQAVIELLETIAEQGLSPREVVERAKQRDEPLVGFGHAVYRVYDPRARVIRKLAEDVFPRLGVSRQLLDIAVELEQTALADDYFVSRGLYPNVDFYSGVILRALGLPVNSFTVLFAMGRLPGWIAHWLELHQQNLPIGRPRQVYTGQLQREALPLDQRPRAAARDAPAQSASRKR